MKNSIILRGVEVTKYFGGLAALNNVDFQVYKGEILGLIGPNGAGKTTLFNVISGVYKPTKGKVYFNGEEITGMKTHQICKLGIGRTYQIPRPLPDVTVLDNILIGSVFGGEKNISLREAREKSIEILKFIDLDKKKSKLGKNLTLMEKKKVELGRALATDPEVLLLDETVAGLNPSEIDEAVELIKKLRDERDITIFWVEHVMRAVMRTSDRIIVLHHGEKIAEGKPNEVSKNTKVIDAYLGERRRDMK